MKARSKVLFLLQRIGPYHQARLLALAEVIGHELVVVEYRADESVYVWDSVVPTGQYVHRRLNDRHELPGLLADLRPTVIVCVGYSDPEIHQVVRWSLARGVRLVVCSDSTFADERRIWAKEFGKRALLGAFDAALVAGQRSREYLGGLGMPAHRCFQPWDVVDSVRFADGAARVRESAAEERLRRGLPKEFFLSVGRFVEKKNIGLLIRAYRNYVTGLGSKSWSLVLAGSGPLEASLRKQAENEGVGDKVIFFGRAEYEALPSLYGLAEGFVIPSTSDQWGLVVNEAMAAGLPVLVSSRCGCAPDLVQEGRNGFSFNPEDTEELCALMERLHSTNPGDRREMGRRSQEVVARFSPAAFASGLNAAVECALEHRGRRIPLSTRLAVRALASRQS